MRCPESSCTLCALRFLRSACLVLRPLTTMYSGAHILQWLDGRKPVESLQSAINSQYSIFLPPLLLTPGYLLLSCNSSLLPQLLPFDFCLKPLPHHSPDIVAEIQCKQHSPFPANNFFVVGNTHRQKKERQKNHHQEIEQSPALRYGNRRY